MSLPRPWTALPFTILVVFALLLAADARAAGFEVTEFSAGLEAEGGTPDLEAGSHPMALHLQASLAPDPQSGSPFTSGDLRNLEFELPGGLVENPTVLPYCSRARLLTPRVNPLEEDGSGKISLSGESCPDRTQVGTITVTSSYEGGATRTFGLFNLVPPPGAPAELGASPFGAPLIFVPRLRQAEGEYGTTLRSEPISQLADISALELTLWGTPWSLLHNSQRGNCLNEAEPDFGWAKCSPGRPSINRPLAYLTAPTSCDAPLQFALRATSWQGGSDDAAQQFGPLQKCSSLAFEPHPSTQLSDPRASSPSGYLYEIGVNQAGITDPESRAPSPARKTVIELPEGLTINPSVGSGLGVCSAAAYAAETAASPPGGGCPAESKIGDFSLISPIVAGPIEGSLYLAAPHENPFGSLIAIYLVARSTQRGIIVKVAGELDPDPASGRLTATFDRLPQLPYSQLAIHFREGQRSPLATPAACGNYASEASLSAWRDPGLITHASLPFSITSGVGGGPCPGPSAPFTPTAAGGSVNSQAGAYSPFYLHLTRTDTEQEITSYSATFPPGLLGKIAGVPYCSDAAIAAAASRGGVEERDRPSCPAASLIGHTTSGYGVGSVLAYAPGNLYLAGPYRGSQISVVAIDSALVGPFDLGVIVVRSAIRLDPISAQASIDATGTDPIPHIRDGIPLHLRDVRVYLDRPQFTINPTSCAPSSIVSQLNGSGSLFADPADDSLASATARFQAFNCSALGFRPRISARVKGHTGRSARPSLRVIVQPRPAQANIASASVALPSSIFLDQANIRALCRRPQFAADECPKSSRFGSVEATTPLLDEALKGDAYLRVSDNQLPDVAFILRAKGFRFDLVGAVDSYKGGLRASFESLPDAPVSKFVLRTTGGPRSLLQASADLCGRDQLLTTRFLGQANRGWVPQTTLSAPCHKPSHRGGRR